MTMTKNEKPISEAGQLRRELIDDELLDQLLASTSEHGITLTGEGGLLPELIKSVLERGMQAELTSHLGYEKHDPAGRGSGNSRNGTTSKTVDTEVGPIELDRPRETRRRLHRPRLDHSPQRTRPPLPRTIPPNHPLTTTTYTDNLTSSSPLQLGDHDQGPP